MKHIINGREWRLSEKFEHFDFWDSNYCFLADGDGVRLRIFSDNFELFCFSGNYLSSISIDEVDFSYLPVKTNHNDPFEVQCLHIADYFCRLFCTWKEN